MLWNITALAAKGASQDSTSVINSIRDVLVDQVGMPLYYAIIAVVAVVALIAILIHLIAAGVSDSGSPQRRSHAIAALVVVGVVLLMAFAPQIINWASSFGGYLPDVKPTAQK